MKYILTFVMLITISQYNFGQDNIYLLYNQLTLSVNPSMAGSACGPRASVYYQQLSYDFVETINFNSKGLNFDIPIVLKNNDKIGLGYRLMHDVAGESKFTNFGNYLSVAYHKSLNKNVERPQYISLGVEAGISKSSINAKGLRWPSQIGPGGFDPTLPTNENISFGVRYLDVNLGLAWTGYIAEKIKSTAGISLNHLNSPNLSFTGTSDGNLYKRLVGHLGFDMALNDNWSLLPFAYYTYRNDLDYYILGTNVAHKFSNYTSVQLGGGYAKNNQPFFSATLNYKMMNLGLAYGFENKAGLDRLEIVFGYAFGNYSCSK